MSQGQSQGLGGISLKSTNDVSGLTADVTNGNPVGTTYKNGIGMAVVADTVAASFVIAGSNVVILGVLRTNPKAGQPGQIGTARGGSEKCLAGGTVAVGDKLITDSSGRFITATGAAQKIVGIAVEAATVGLPFEAVLVDSYVA